MAKRKVEIWFQPTKYTRKVAKPDNHINRLRLLVSGEGAYYFAESHYNFYFHYINEGFLSCYSPNELPVSLVSQRKLMHEYDKKKGFPKATYIGYFYEEAD